VNGALRGAVVGTESVRATVERADRAAVERRAGAKFAGARAPGVQAARTAAVVADVVERNLEACTEVSGERVDNRRRLFRHQKGASGLPAMFRG